MCTSKNGKAKWCLSLSSPPTPNTFSLKSLKKNLKIQASIQKSTRESDPFNLGQISYAEWFNSQILSFSKSLRCCEQRDQMWEQKISLMSFTLRLLLSLGHCTWCVGFFSIALNLQPVPLLWARILSASLACYFAFSLSSVFFPISNYLLVSEVQPRIFHGISPTSSSPFGHCWVFRGESRLWHVHYGDLEQYTGKAIQLPVPWHHFFLAFWLEGLAEEEVWFDA